MLSGTKEKKSGVFFELSIISSTGGGHVVQEAIWVLEEVARGREGIQGKSECFVLGAFDASGTAARDGGCHGSVSTRQRTNVILRQELKQLDLSSADCLLLRRKCWSHGPNVGNSQQPTASLRDAQRESAVASATRVSPLSATIRGVVQVGADSRQCDIYSVIKR